MSMGFLSFFFFSSRRRHTRFDCDWSSDVCSSDLLLIAGILAVLGAAGYWTPWGLDAMLLADVVLIALIWLDATLAQTVAVNREPLPALSVGHTGEVVYRWSNPSSRAARLNVREVRPEILGGPQPARALRIPP